MVIPTKAEIDKKHKEYTHNLSKLNDDGVLSSSWAVKTLHSAIRKEWMKSPTKLAVLYEAMHPDLNPKTRTKWLFRCAICNELFKGADVEVDHIKGEHSFLSIDDFRTYWDNILMVPKSGLQVLCKQDHAIKTYSERYNVSWSEAIKRKNLINKLNQPVNIQKKELQAAGFTSNMVSNEEKRTKCYIKLLEGGE